MRLLNDRAEWVKAPFPHDHSIRVDAEGNGTALWSGSPSEGHEHAISRWEIQSSAGHTHRFPTPAPDLRKTTPVATSQTALRNKVGTKKPDLGRM